MQQLIISSRPRGLDSLIGQDKLVKKIRNHMKSRPPKAWLFTSPKGTGKTTLARILALSMQCKHQDKFGQPCKDCRRNRGNFPIYSINCAVYNKTEQIKERIANASYVLGEEGHKRVYILDEVHQLSSYAQDFILDSLEDEDDNDNVWILCTTRPDKIVDTLRSRCISYSPRTWDTDDITLCVRRLLKRVDSNLSVDALVDTLVEKQVFSPRLVCQAVEKYVAGNTPEDAADVDSISEVDSLALCRDVTNGRWEPVARLLYKAPLSSVRGLRTAVLGYLRIMLLDSPDINSKSTEVAGAIKRLAYVPSAEDANTLAALTAELYTLCKTFGSK